MTTVPLFVEPDCPRCGAPMGHPCTNASTGYDLANVHHARTAELVRALYSEVYRLQTIVAKVTK